MKLTLVEIECHGKLTVNFQMFDVVGPRCIKNVTIINSRWNKLKVCQPPVIYDLTKYHKIQHLPSDLADVMTK